MRAYYGHNFSHSCAMHSYCSPSFYFQAQLTLSPKQCTGAGIFSNQAQLALSCLLELKPLKNSLKSQVHQPRQCKPKVAKHASHQLFGVAQYTSPILHFFVSARWTGLSIPSTSIPIRAGPSQSDTSGKFQI